MQCNLMKLAKTTPYNNIVSGMMKWIYREKKIIDYIYIIWPIVSQMA